MLGAEIWQRRRRRQSKSGTGSDPVAWAREKGRGITEAQRATEREMVDQEMDRTFELCGLEESSTFWSLQASV